MKKRILLFILITTCCIQVWAQATISLLGPAPAGGPSGTGPTTDSQVVTLYMDTAIPSRPAISATFSLSNQQYSQIEGHPNTPGIVFGSTIVAGSRAITPDSLYPLIETYGSQNEYYTACPSCPTGTGIDIARHHALQIQSFSDALIDKNGTNLKPVNAKVWFADLTVNFDIPVTNPVFHFTGLGAWVFKSFTANGRVANYDLGISAELDLLTPGVRLSRLSGSPYFSVLSGTTIKNTAAYLGDGSAIHGIERSSASGSALVIGKNISTIRFRISLRGDGGSIVDNTGSKMQASGGNFIGWALADNTSAPSATTTAGDGFLVSVSLLLPDASSYSGAYGVQKQESSERITIEADPVTETLRIFPLQLGDLVELTDMTGRIVLTKVATARIEKINTHSLPTAMYNVTIYSREHNKKHIQKVVKL